MQTLSDIRALLASRGLRPRHRWGQNFLHDHNQIRKLLTAAAVQPGELVLEVGPGTGVLTEALLDAGARVVACEIDPQMAAIVRERVEARTGSPAPQGVTSGIAANPLRLIVGDCLDGKRALHADLHAMLVEQPFVLVANLPYGAATPLMATLLVSYERCRGLCVTVQREVADRLAAGPGTKDYGPLSVLTQTLAEVDLVSVLPGSCFWPPPEVTSAMVAVRRRSPSAIARAGGPIDAQEREALAAFTAQLFATRRKQLGAVLGRQVPLPSWISATSRAEALAPEAIVRLWRETRALPDLDAGSAPAGDNALR